MKFDDSVLRLINRHALKVVYKKTTSRTYDPSTGMTTDSETSFDVISYPKHIKATQYYMPNLIGKDSVLFYIRNDGRFSIDVKDSIEYNGKIYVVDTYTNHIALGKVIMYTVVGVKA